MAWTAQDWKGGHKQQKDKGNELRQDGRQAGASQYEDKMEERLGAGRQAQEGGHSIPDQLGDKMKLGDKTWLYLVAEMSLLTSGVSCWTVGLLLRVFPLVDACLDHILGIMFEIAASFYVQTQVPSSHCKPHHVLMQQRFLLLYTSPCSPFPARWRNHSWYPRNFCSGVLFPGRFVPILYILFPMLCVVS